MSLSLVISNLTLEEIKQLLKHVRELEETEPGKLIFCQIKGLEGKSKEEAIKILLEIFPKRHVAG